jgi:hypothetical protein
MSGDLATRTNHCNNKAAGLHAHGSRLWPGLLKRDPSFQYIVAAFTTYMFWILPEASQKTNAGTPGRTSHEGGDVQSTLAFMMPSSIAQYQSHPRSIRPAGHAQVWEL